MCYPAAMSGSELKPVREVLPHRPPFLFLDEILEMTEVSIRARRTARAEEPHFEGHYPGKPIMPGVLLCETVLQAGAYLMAAKMGLDQHMEGAPVVTRMNKVRFKRMIKPGDILDIKADHQRTKMGVHMLTGSIECEGELVCSLEFTLMLVPESSEDSPQ